MSVKFTHETVQRALVSHERHGRIRSWKIVQGPRAQRYVIDLFDYGTFDGTLRECHALVIGLRVGALKPDAQSQPVVVELDRIATALEAFSVRVERESTVKVNWPHEASRS